METKVFLTRLGQFQNIGLDADRVDRLIAPGGMFDQLQFIKSILFQLDVTGFEPMDNIDFYQGDES